jgi:hypothetical protein
MKCPIKKGRRIGLFCIYNFELIFALLPTAAQLLPVVAAESAYMLVAGSNCFWALVLQIA